eukprot:109613_1
MDRSCVSRSRVSVQIPTHPTFLKYAYKIPSRVTTLGHCDSCVYPTTHQQFRGCIYGVFKERDFFVVCCNLVFGKKIAYPEESIIFNLVCELHLCAYIYVVKM